MFGLHAFSPLLIMLCIVIVNSRKMQAMILEPAWKFENNEERKEEHFYKEKTIFYDFTNSTLNLSWPTGFTVGAELVQSEDACIFHGKFHTDPTSSVLVTGCDVLDIQYHSLVFGHRMLVGIDGAIVSVENAEKLGKKGYRNRISEFSEPEEDFLESPSFNAKYPYSEATKLPSLLNLNVNVYLDYEWIKHHGGSMKGKDKAKEVLQHVQQLFIHHLLGPKINISHNNNIYTGRSHLQPTEEDLERVEYYLFGPWTVGGSNVAHVYLTHTRRVITESVSVQDSICDENVRKPRSIIRWDWTTSRTAIAVAHALAHNLGVHHDFDLGAGLQDSCEHREWTEETIRNHANNGIAWSSCSQADFVEYYGRVFSKNGRFCL
eukprot:GFUD01013404.1.p1 GENE.GFUD01013404.1~~GFUD01013404.1.p1  ORF type:complete len:377 (+),score=72.66 GFUD01013404.1:28-1158(+)